MKKGDWIVCVYHRFVNIGERGYPSSYGFEGEKPITYFDTIENIREEKINSILK